MFYLFSYNFKKHNIGGFTLIELLVVIAVMAILAAIAIPSYHSFQNQSDLNNTTQEIINVLRLAQNRTWASEGATSSGIYFDDTTSPHQYTLFKGSNYSSGSDYEVKELPDTVEFSEINFGGGKEVVFERLSGEVAISGSLTVRLISDVTKTKSIYVATSGLSSFANPLPGSGRITDSRHVHFNYDRVIDTSTTTDETITLSFNGVAVTEDIIISENIVSGQIYWEGEVDVGGDIQELKIHTHRLNNPDTEFCIHRDKRYNNKSLTLDLDLDPDLISYTADGDFSVGASIYVGNWEIQ